MSMDMPEKATPSRMPELMASLGFILTIRPMIIMMTGTKTDAPTLFRNV
jgi:hypothetical protein